VITEAAGCGSGEDAIEGGPVTTVDDGGTHPELVVPKSARESA